MRTVALTFDDGPGPHTPEVLAVLARHRVRATFFVVGRHLAAHPDLARAVADAGHALGNHSYSHPQDIEGCQPRGAFDGLPAAVQAEQLDRTSRLIEEVAGAPPQFFRGPGGEHFGPVTAALIAARGMALAHWTADTEDWTAPGGLSAEFQERVVALATVAAAAGAAHPVVLMHDGKASPEPEGLVSGFRGNTVAALDRIIGYYLERGYTFTDPAGTPL